MCRGNQWGKFEGSSWQSTCGPLQLVSLYSHFWRTCIGESMEPQALNLWSCGGKEDDAIYGLLDQWVLNVLCSELVFPWLQELDRGKGSLENRDQQIAASIILVLPKNLFLEVSWNHVGQHHFYESGFLTRLRRIDAFLGVFWGKEFFRGEIAETETCCKHHNWHTESTQYLALLTPAFIPGHTDSEQSGSFHTLCFRQALAPERLTPSHYSQYIISASDRATLAN